MKDSLYVISDNYCEIIDTCVGRIMDKLDENTIIIITSDHGRDRMTNIPSRLPA